MNDSEMQIAIAQACGWTEIEECTCHNRQYKGFEPNPGQHKKHTPDYLNDLNAMHEAEKVLTPDQVPAYWSMLLSIASRDCELLAIAHDKYVLALMSTATQRAEAFFRALIIHGTQQFTKGDGL